MTTKRNSGFTFIELLCAASIIAILAAILFPVFARARDKAHQSSCAVNLQNIGVALRVYASENYGHFPAQEQGVWALLPAFLTDAEALQCPSQRAAREFRGRMHGSGGEQVGKPVTGGLISDYIYDGGWCDDDDPRRAIACDDVYDRHNGGCGYLFLDGHVRWLAVKDDRENEEIPGVKKLREMGRADAEQ